MSEQDLVEIDNTLEGKVEQLIEEIEKETNSYVRKEIRKERNELKKCVKIIREDFIPRMAKYKEQNEIFAIETAIRKQIKKRRYLYAYERRTYEKWTT